MIVQQKKNMIPFFLLILIWEARTSYLHLENNAYAALLCCKRRLFFWLLPSSPFLSFSLSLFTRLVLLSPSSQDGALCVCISNGRSIHTHCYCGYNSVIFETQK